MQLLFELVCNCVIPLLDNPVVYLAVAQLLCTNGARPHRKDNEFFPLVCPSLYRQRAHADQ